MAQFVVSSSLDCHLTWARSFSSPPDKLWIKKLHKFHRLKVLLLFVSISYIGCNRFFSLLKFEFRNRENKKRAHALSTDKKDRIGKSVERKRKVKLINKNKRQRGTQLNMEFRKETNKLSHRNEKFQHSTDTSHGLWILKRFIDCHREEWVRDMHIQQWRECVCRAKYDGCSIHGHFMRMNDIH